MPEQFHQGRHADTRAKHLRRVCVPQAVGDDAVGDTGAAANLIEVIPQLANECCFSAGTRDKQSVGRGRFEGTEEAEALHDFTNERIDRHHAFGFQLAERYENGPLIRA